MIPIITSLIATAISFIDAEIIAQQPKGKDIGSFIDAKFLLGSVIALLNGDQDADDKLAFAHQRRKDRK